MRFLLFNFILFTAVSIGAAQIKISAQRNIKFSDYKTFAIQKGQIVSLGVEQSVNENKLFNVLKLAIIREMTMRGYTLTSDSTADFVITYVYEEADRSTYQKPGPLGQTPKDDPADVDESNRSNITRNLIIEIERNKNSLWTATCLLNKSVKDIYGLVDMTTTSAFHKFPTRKNN